MPVCTFFGHRDCPSSVKPQLRDAIVDLIEKQRVDTFYVGDSGAYDRMVRAILRELVPVYPQIRYQVVLAYMPGKKDGSDHSDTLLPEGIETVPRRFAISYRNQWMLRQADYVVTYVTHSWGGAAQFAELAERQAKTVINLA